MLFLLCHFASLLPDFTALALHHLFWALSFAYPFLSLFLLHLHTAVSIRLSLPPFLFLAKSVGTLLLMLVTEGLSHSFCGQADPKHFTCFVPHCWFLIAPLVASISIVLC